MILTNQYNKQLTSRAQEIVDSKEDLYPRLARHEVDLYIYFEDTIIHLVQELLRGASLDTQVTIIEVSDNPETDEDLWHEEFQLRQQIYLQAYYTYKDNLMDEVLRITMENLKEHAKDLTVLIEQKKEEIERLKSYNQDDYIIQEEQDYLEHELKDLIYSLSNTTMTY